MRWPVGKYIGKLITRAVATTLHRLESHHQTVIVIPEGEFGSLSRKRTGLKEAIIHGPDLSNLDLTRGPSPMREIHWRDALER